MLAIVGESGAGKSSLLHILGALDRASAGDVYCAQIPVSKLTDDAAADFRNREIGFVWQFHYLLPDLSAVENVALPLLIARWSRNKASSRALDLLQETGLADRADHPISHLSGGEQQRVAVARALITEPKLLLADEPTGNLDEAISEQIGRTLVDYSRKYSAITIIATHSSRLAGLCDRSLVLEDGRTH